jgi:hypothetical protein
MLLAATAKDVFGEIKPTGPLANDPTPIVGLSRLIVFGIQALILVSGIALLIYLLWGAFDYLTSQGDPDKIKAAQTKITNAVIGIILVIAAFTLFVVVAVYMLGIVEFTGGTIIFKVPTLQ